MAKRTTLIIPPEKFYVQWTFYQHFSKLAYFKNAFGPLGTSCEKGTAITVLQTTHMLQNKELLSLKQWYHKIRYKDRTVSFKAIQWYILLP